MTKLKGTRGTFVEFTAGAPTGRTAGTRRGAGAHVNQEELERGVPLLNENLPYQTVPQETLGRGRPTAAPEGLRSQHQPLYYPNVHPYLTAQNVIPPPRIPQGALWRPFTEVSAPPTGFPTAWTDPSRLSQQSLGVPSFHYRRACDCAQLSLPAMVDQAGFTRHVAANPVSQFRSRTYAHARGASYTPSANRRVPVLRQEYPGPLPGSPNNIPNFEFFMFCRNQDYSLLYEHLAQVCPLPAPTLHSVYLMIVCQISENLDLESFRHRLELFLRGEVERNSLNVMLDFMVTLANHWRSVLRVNSYFQNQSNRPRPPFYPTQPHHGNITFLNRVPPPYAHHYREPFPGRTHTFGPQRFRPNPDAFPQRIAPQQSEPVEVITIESDDDSTTVPTTTYSPNRGTTLDTAPGSSTLDTAAPGIPHLRRTPDADPPGTPYLGTTPDVDPPGTPYLGTTLDVDPPGTPYLGTTPDAATPGTPYLRTTPDAAAPGTLGHGTNLDTATPGTPEPKATLDTTTFGTPECKSTLDATAFETPNVGSTHVAAAAAPCTGNFGSTLDVAPPCRPNVGPSLDTTIDTTNIGATEDTVMPNVDAPFSQNITQTLEFTPQRLNVLDTPSRQIVGQTLEFTPTIPNVRPTLEFTPTIPNVRPTLETSSVRPGLYLSRLRPGVFRAMYLKPLMCNTSSSSAGSTLGIIPSQSNVRPALDVIPLGQNVRPANVTPLGSNIRPALDIIPLRPPQYLGTSPRRDLGSSSSRRSFQSNAGTNDIALRSSSQRLASTLQSDAVTSGGAPESFPEWDSHQSDKPSSENDTLIDDAMNDTSESGSDNELLGSISQCERNPNPLGWARDNDNCETLHLEVIGGAQNVWPSSDDQVIGQLDCSRVRCLGVQTSLQHLSYRCEMELAVSSGVDNRHITARLVIHLTEDPRKKETEWIKYLMEQCCRRERIGTILFCARACDIGMNLKVCFYAQGLYNMDFFSSTYFSREQVQEGCKLVEPKKLEVSMSSEKQLLLKTVLTKRDATINDDSGDDFSPLSGSSSNEEWRLSQASEGSEESLESTKKVKKKYLLRGKGPPTRRKARSVLAVARSIMPARPKGFVLPGWYKEFVTFMRRNPNVPFSKCPLKVPPRQLHLKLSNLKTLQDMINVGQVVSGIRPEETGRIIMFNNSLIMTIIRMMRRKRQRINSDEDSNSEGNDQEDQSGQFENHPRAFKKRKRVELTRSVEKNIKRRRKRQRIDSDDSSSAEREILEMKVCPEKRNHVDSTKFGNCVKNRKKDSMLCNNHKEEVGEHPQPANLIKKRKPKSSLTRNEPDCKKARSEIYHKSGVDKKATQVGPLIVRLPITLYKSVMEAKEGSARVLSYKGSHLEMDRAKLISQLTSDSPLDPIKSHEKKPNNSPNEASSLNDTEDEVYQRLSKMFEIPLEKPEKEQPSDSGKTDKDPEVSRPVQQATPPPASKIPMRKEISPSQRGVVREMLDKMGVVTAVPFTLNDTDDDDDEADLVVDCGAGLW